MPLSFAHRHMEEIEECLDTLYWDTEARTVLLAYDNGQFISQRGEFEDRQLAVLSALAAAQLSATQEVAKLVGEKKQFQLLQEGEEQSIYIVAVDYELILVVVFNTETPLGVVRMVIRQVAERLQQLADDARFGPPDEADELEEDNEFARLLVDELDDLFS